MSAGNTSGSGTLRSIAGFVGLSVLGGILAAALVIPAVTVAGVAANSAVGVFDALPSSLEPGNLSEPSRIYALDAEKNPVEIAQIYIDNRRTIPWEGLNDNVKHATLAAEDRRFYDHNGVDLVGVVRAAINNFAGGATEGSSTITMQFVRNTLVLQALAKDDKQGVLDALDATIERKLEEIKYAVGIEKRFSKDEILLGYLNSINFGNVYGIEAAALKYYSKSAKDLTVPEAASLIAIVQLPEAFRLDHPESETNGAANGYAANKVRRDLIINNMLEEGYITKAEAEEAIATPITPVLKEISSGCQYATVAPFFCDYVLSVLKTSDLYDEVFAGSDEDRYTQLARGGFHIYTTIDLRLQETERANVEHWAPPGFGPIDLGGTAISVEVGTGRILAMAQNRAYDATAEKTSRVATSVNYNTDVENGGSTGFQPGSTWKTFTLATWLENGHSLDELVSGSLRDFPMSSFTQCGSPLSGRPYGPRNASPSPPSVTALGAMIQSINTALLDMATRLDLCDISQTAQDLGMRRADGNELNKGPSSTLGSEEVAPIRLAAAYAAISNNGTYCPPIAIDRIVDRNGEDLQLPKPDCTQALEPDVAAGVIYALKRVITQGTGTGSNPRNGLNVFGKTGTNDRAWQTWIVTSTPQVATAVWVGNVTGKVSTGNYAVHGVNLSTVRHRIMRDILLKITELYGPGVDWPAPSGALVTGSKVPLQDVAGLPFDDAKSLLEDLGFRVIDGGPVLSVKPVNVVESTNPPGGTGLTAGATVTIYKSDGNGFAIPNVAGLSQAEAKAAFASAGHTGSFTSVNTAYSSTVPAGKVIKVDNGEPGSVLDKSTLVSFTISDGPDPNADDDSNRPGP